MISKARERILNMTKNLQDDRYRKELATTDAEKNLWRDLATDLAEQLDKLQAQVDRLKESNKELTDILDRRTDKDLAESEGAKEPPLDANGKPHPQVSSQRLDYEIGGATDPGNAIGDTEGFRGDEYAP